MLLHVAKLNSVPSRGRVGIGSMLIMLLAIAVSFGCDASEMDDESEMDDSTMSLSVATDAEYISVEFALDDDLYVVQCTNHLKAYRVSDGVRGEALGSEFHGEDVWNGYYLDDTFIPPRMNEGCDVLACTPLQEISRAVSLEDLHLDGTRALTDADKALVAERTWENFPIPETVNAYTTYIYTGVVEVELSAFSHNQCDFDGDTGITLTQRIIVE